MHGGFLTFCLAPISAVPTSVVFVCKQMTAFQTFSPYMIVSEWNSFSPWVLEELKFVPMIVVSMNFILLIVWKPFVFRW